MWCFLETHRELGLWVWSNGGKNLNLTKEEAMLKKFL